MKETIIWNKPQYPDAIQAQIKIADCMNRVRYLFSELNKDLDQYGYYTHSEVTIEVGQKDEK